MNKDKVIKAVAEAKRFLATVKDANDRDRTGDYYSPSKESGALKRASMDLTRALAEMRRSN